MRRHGLTLAFLLLAASGNAATPPAAEPLVPAEVIALTKAADDALDIWDLPAAQAAADELEKRAPDSLDSMEMRAIVRFHEGRYAEAVKLLDAVAKKGRRDEANWLVKLIRNTAKVTQHFKEKKGEHFIVRYEPGPDELLADWTLETLEAQRAALVADLGYAPPEVVPVEIYATGDKFATVTTLTRAEIETTGTIALCKFNRLMITTPGALSNGYPWRDTLAHEYTHYVVARMTGNKVPIWLHEGLAKYLEVRWRKSTGGERSPTTDTVLAEAMQRQYFVPFQKMHPSIAKLPSAFDATLAFAEVETTIGYLVDTHGQDALRKLLTGLRDGKAMDVALLDAYGVGLSGLEAKLKEHLAANPPKLYPGLEVMPVALKDPDADDDASGASTKHLSEDASNHLRLGDLLAGLGNEVDEYGRPRGGHSRPEAAVVEYRRARDAEKRSKAKASYGPIFDYKIGFLYLRTNRFPEARKALGTVLETYPTYSPGLKAIGEIELRDGDPKKAKAWLEQSLLLAPFDPNVYAMLSEACNKSGDKACADENQKRLQQLMAIYNPPAPARQGHR